MFFNYSSIYIRVFEYIQYFVLFDILFILILVLLNIWVFHFVLKSGKGKSSIEIEKLKNKMDELLDITD